MNEHDTVNELSPEESLMVKVDEAFDLAIKTAAESMFPPELDAMDEEMNATQQMQYDAMTQAINQAREQVGDLVRQYAEQQEQALENAVDTEVGESREDNTTRRRASDILARATLRDSWWHQKEIGSNFYFMHVAPLALVLTADRKENTVRVSLRAQLEQDRDLTLYTRVYAGDGTLSSNDPRDLAIAHTEDLLNTIYRRMIGSLTEESRNALYHTMRLTE